eukprot:TRINITY_DN1973_c0_g1_i3.p1 TRINITY_DN1973_c0_g1~~TRINITY_DN1973_c0_g1_i3.p1  ORF type:complete len:342 (+),score=129.67 TRINITY_DN1973_c0_g1_i3:84-1028(+)
MCIRDSPEIDVVLKQSQFYAIRRNKDWAVRPFYVQVGDDLIRTVIHKTNPHPYEGWILNVMFKRFIPGRPNLLTVPIVSAPQDTTQPLYDGGEVSVEIQEVDIITYNENYPSRLRIDLSNLTPQHPYRLGDLAATLPDGVMLAPNYQRMLGLKVATVEMRAEKYRLIAYEKYGISLEEEKAARREEKRRAEEEKKQAEQEAFVKGGLTQEKLELLQKFAATDEKAKALLDVALAEPKEKVKKVKKVHKPRNIKKEIQEMNAKIKAELGQGDEKKSNRKKAEQNMDPTLLVQSFALFCFCVLWWRCYFLCRFGMF